MRAGSGRRENADGRDTQKRVRAGNHLKYSKKIRGSLWLHFKPSTLSASGNNSMRGIRAGNQAHAWGSVWVGSRPSAGSEMLRNLSAISRSGLRSPGGDRLAYCWVFRARSPTNLNRYHKLGIIIAWPSLNRQCMPLRSLVPCHIISSITWSCCYQPGLPF
jgi:hypothetical protein